MGRTFSQTLKVLFIIAVAAVLEGCSACDDGSGLAKVCPINRPCGITNNGTVVLAAQFKDQSLYNTGVCRFGLIECDDEGNEMCIGFVPPSDEICDELDNDCDGETDEFFDLDFDGFTSCGGDCDDKHTYANPNAKEICDGRDNDCDGKIDEDIQPINCWGGPTNSVIDGTTPCKRGQQFCLNGRWGSCNNQTLPGTETCNSIDDDCNGVIDDVRRTDCGPSDENGICSFGSVVCVAGESKCIDAIYPQAEECDGVDNDCDGAYDEGLVRRCTSVCGQGLEICNAGQWVDCDAQQPEVELCDLIDNDCDGETDEGCSCVLGMARPCNQNIVDSMGNIVNCGLGVQYCDEFGLWGLCYFATTSPETCNNWDDDCDGNIDGMTQDCGNRLTAGIGECRLGTSTCAAGMWTDCAGAVSPLAEICDHLDNDCDGDIDEDLNPHNKVDMIFAIDISGSMCPFINALSQGITQYVAQFQNTEHRFGLLVYPGIYSVNPSLNHMIMTNPPLVSVGTFRNVLANLQCNGGGSEPSWDVMHMLTDPADPIGVGWRMDAYPYIVMVTDEPAQTWTGLAEVNIVPQATNCRVGDCQPGDSYETYIITNTTYFQMWDDIVNNDPDRLINIYPPDSMRYTELLRNIFENICI